MRPWLATALTVASLVAAPLVAGGCNAITGVSDLEPVECVGDCDEADAKTDARADALADGAADAAADAKTDAKPDALGDTGGDAPVDSSSDAGADTGCVLNSQCNDENACTKDLCNGLGVCTNPLEDGDGDGEAPTTLGACGLDCHDGNKDVFSKQTQFFDAPYTLSKGTTSWDYDCNGVDERQHADVFKCVVSGTKCIVTPGWSGTIPACGALGTYVTVCNYLSFTKNCIPNTSTKIVQRCR